MRTSMLVVSLLVGLASSSALGQTGSLVLDGQGATPIITLQTNVSAGSKAGETQHHIFGPYNSTSGDPGALYISAGKSPTGGKNDIWLYNHGCDGGCNVPQIGLAADTTVLGGVLAFPDGTVQTTAVVSSGGGIKHARVQGCTIAVNTNSCNVTVNWSAAFADTNYTFVCMPQGGLALSITSKTSSSATVTLSDLSVVGANGQQFFTGELNCIAMHD